MTFATTIKKKWWNKKMQQYEQKGYFYEYKRYNSYWDVRLSKIDTLPVDAVFLVGSVPHRASITRICHVSMYNIPVDICKFLMEDANALMSDMVWVLKCENSDQNISYHFADIGKTINMPKGATKQKRRKSIQTKKKKSIVNLMTHRKSLIKRWND